MPSSSKRENVGYLLPANPLVAARRYVCVPVPDDERHIQAFLAQIDMLGYWYTWEKDASKTARLAASVWRDIAMSVRDAFYSGTGCEAGGMQIRQNPENECQLETSEDGINWTLLFDTTDCIRGTVKGALGAQSGVFIQEGDTVTQVTNIDAYYDGRQYYNYTGRTGDDTEIKCLAALNATNVIALLHYEVGRRYGAGIGIAASALLAAAIMVAIGTPIGEFVLEPARNIAYLGIAMGFPGLFSSTIKREFACVLSNNATVTSGVVSFDYAAILIDVEARRSLLPSAWDAIWAYLKIIDVDGLNIAGDTKAIADACCDFCSTTQQTAELLLTQAVEYHGATAQKTAATNNTITYLTDGISINANGNTLYGQFQWTFELPLGCELISIGFKVLTAGEPINSVVLQVNGVTIATKTNHRPYGNYYYVGSTVNSGLMRILWSAYNNNTTTGYFKLERVYITYRGCNPFAAYQ